MKITEALTRLEEMLRAEGKSTHTIRAYITDMKMLVIQTSPDLVDWKMCDLPSAERAAEYTYWVQTWVNETRAKVSASTTIRRIAASKAMARALGFPEPFASYIAPKAVKGKAHPLPGMNADVQKLLVSAENPEQRCLIVLLGEVGCRVSEALAIRGCDFANDGAVWWATIRGKGDKTRQVPVPLDTYETCIEPMIRKRQAEPWLPLLQFTDRHARRLVKNLGEKAGLARSIASHDLRMTYGTCVYESSHDLRATQELLGHASSSTTETYTMVRDRAKVAAVMGAFK